MSDEVFDLNAFCDIMNKYFGFSIEYLATTIFKIISPSSLRRITKYERPIKSLKEDQKHIDLYAANLAKTFTEEDKKSGQSLKLNCYTLFVQGLKGTPLCNKIQIVDPSQLPSDTDEREKEYEKLATAVLEEAFSATLTTAIEKNRLKDVKNKELSEQATDDLPKITDPVVSEPTKSTNPIVVEPLKISNPQSVIDSISTLNKDPIFAALPKASNLQNIIDSISHLTKDEKKAVFNSLVQDMRGDYLSEFEQDLYYTFVKDYLLDTNHTYIEQYNETVEVFISKDNSYITKDVTSSFTLITDHPETIQRSFDRSFQYVGDITDLHDINSSSRTEDRLKLFIDAYVKYDITINNVKIDNVFQYFVIKTDPDEFKGAGSQLYTAIILDDLLRSFKSNELKIYIKCSSKTIGLYSERLYTLTRFTLPVKYYLFTCVLKDGTSNNWKVSLLPILPGYFPRKSIKYSQKNFVTQNSTENSKTISINNWVTPGFGLLYVLEYKHLLFANTQE